MQWFKKWFGRSARPRGAVSRTSFRPQVENLEARRVMSATSAISNSWWQATRWGGTVYMSEQDLFAIDSATQHLVEYSDLNNQGTQKLLYYGPQVADLSAGLSPTGSPVAYLVSSADHTVWMAAPHLGGVYPTQLEGGYLGTVYASQVSATRDGAVYAVDYSTGQVWFRSWNGAWQSLGSPGGQGVLQITAGATGGADEVFAIGRQDNAIYVNKGTSPGGWQMVDKSLTFVKLSATQDDHVYALDFYGTLTRETENHFYWNGHAYDWWSGQRLAAYQNGVYGASHYVALSAGTDAGGQDVVYVIDQNQLAIRYDAGGSPTYMDSSVKEIAGDAGGRFYDVNYVSTYSTTGTPWKYDPSTGGFPWQMLDSSGSVV
jgi:hypothetical protein